jgi:uncharacterized protein
MPIARDVPKIVGYALIWDSLSLPIMDKNGVFFREKFEKGAFDRALATGADVRALVSHDGSLILGRSNGRTKTLEIREDNRGLLVEITPPQNALGKIYTDAVRRGDLTGMSFRFYSRRERWSGYGDDRIRTVAEAELDDVSIVAYPAYPDTHVFVEDPPLARRPAAAAASAPRHAPAAKSRAGKPARDWYRLARLRLAEATL